MSVEEKELERTEHKKARINLATTLGLSVSLLSLAAILASCDSGSKGTDPQAEDSSGSVAVTSSSGGLHTSSSSGAAEPLSSGVVPGSSSGVIGSSSGTQVRSSSSVSSSSGSGEACDEEGTTKRSYENGVWTKYICTSGLWIVYVASSSSAASSSSYYDMDSLFSSIENLSYGEFTDPRDGQVYKTIVVNPGKLFEYEIFAENLNYGKQISGSADQTDSTKYCYNDDPWYCAHHFGGLYQWSTAMGFPPACNDVKAGSTAACPDSIVLPTEYSEAEFYVQHQGICPAGWHVMNEGEWAVVIGGGGSPLKSQVLWRVHSNSKGLSILPAGYRDSMGVYFYLGSEADFWLPHEHSTDINRAYLVYLDDNIKDVVRNGDAWIRKTTGMSVRCVSDHEGM
jgi:uncharacterized protein (TIGR02145 family)